MIPRGVQRDDALTIDAVIKVREHDPPIPHGTFIKCIYGEATVHLYSTLKYAGDGHNVPEDMKVTMKDAGVGSVVGIDYYICPLEMTYAKIAAPKMDNISYQLQPLVISNVYKDMYYCVAFMKGLFWARFDWVKVVSTKDLT